MNNKKCFIGVLIVLSCLVNTSKVYSQKTETDLGSVTNSVNYSNKSKSVNKIKILDTLSVTITADPNVICLGNSSQLNAVISGGNGSYTLIWSSNPADPSIIGQEIIPNPVVSPQVTTTYTLIVMDGENNVVSNNIVLLVSPIPMADFSADKLFGTVPIDINFTNLSLNANSYFWDFGDGNTSSEENPVHTYTQAGVFTIKLLVTNSFTGCSDSITKEGYVDVIAGINNNYNKTIDLYPNPANKYIFINIPDTEKINQLIIYDNLGQKVLQINNSKNKIDISMLKKGMYIIELQTNNELYRNKIIIN